jgi:hypothetical protein
VFVDEKLLVQTVSFEGLKDKPKLFAQSLSLFFFLSTKEEKINKSMRFQKNNLLFA